MTDHAIVSTEIKIPQCRRVDPAQTLDVGLELLRSEQYELAAQAYQNAIDRGYRPGTAYYNQACAYALAGNTDAAFASLRKALDNGFDSPAHLAKDDDLDSLHSDPRWAGIKKDARALSLPGYNQHWWNDGSRAERTAVQS